MGVLVGKAVVITGAGRGLGAAYALNIALAGAAVLVNDVDGELADVLATRIIERGGRAAASIASVRDPDQVAGIVQQCLTEFGRLDGLVNNAGLSYLALPWEENLALAP